MIEFVILIIWFLVLTLPAGLIFILLIERTSGCKKFTSAESFYFSIVVGLVYLAFVSDLLLAFRSLNLVNYLISIVICYVLHFSIAYVARGKRLMTRYELSYLLKTRFSNTLQLWIAKFRESKYHYFGLLVIILYSTISRLPGPLSTAGVLASDTWGIMALGNYVKHLGYIPEEFVYIFGVGDKTLLGLMFTCGLDPLFITKFLQPVVIQPLITVTILLFLKKLRLRDRYVFLGALLFILAPQLKIENEIYHPRNLGYLLAFTSVYVMTFYRKHNQGSTLLGTLIGGICLYHLPNAIPILILLFICAVVELSKGFVRHSATSKLRGLIEVSSVAFLLVSPLFVRTLMLFSTSSRYYSAFVTSSATSTVEQEISAGWPIIIENTFKTMEFYTAGGLIAFIFAFLALLLNIKLKKYDVNFTSLYFLILFFLGFNPYTRYIWGAYDRYRFFTPFAFPEAVLVCVFMQYLHEYRIKLGFESENSGKSRELNLTVALRYLFTILLLSIVISSALLSYPYVFYREVHADDADLLEALNFIKENSDVNSKILTYTPGRYVNGDIAGIAFAWLAPRTIIGDDIVLMGPSNIHQYMKCAEVKYVLVFQQDYSEKELIEAHFNVKTFGKYLVVWISES